MNKSNVSYLEPATETLRKWDEWEILLLVILICAIIGNTFMIIIMRSNRMRKTNESLLAIIISALNIFSLLIKFLVSLQKIYRIPIYNACILVQFVLPQILVWEIYWLLLILTVERYFFVVKRFKVYWMLSRKNCIIIVLSMFAIFSTLSSTQAICLEYHEKKSHYCVIKNSSQLFGTTNNLSFCLIYMKNVFPWIKSTLMSWIPWTFFNILILMNVFDCNTRHGNVLVVPKEQIMKYSELGYSWTQLNTLKEKRTDSENSTTKKSKLSEKCQVTLVLCIISSTFFLLTAPFTILEVIRKVNHNNEYIKSIVSTRSMHRMGHFLLDFMHLTLFIFYFAFSHGFRSELKILLNI